MGYSLGSFYIYAFALAALLSFGIAAFAVRHPSNRVGQPLSGFLFGVGLWSLADALRLAAPTRSHVLFWNKVSYVGIVVIPPTLVVFILRVTGRERWLKRKYLLGLAAVSLAALAVVLTNHLHGLWRAGETVTPQTAPPVLVEERGPLWYPWVAYVYTVVILMLYLLVREFLQRNESRIYRNQIGTLFVAFLLSSVTTLLFVVGVLPFDLSPIGFTGMGLLFAVAIFRYQLLDITPIARDVVLDNMDSGVLVVDSSNTILDANERAREIIQDSDTVRGKQLSAVVPGDFDAGDTLPPAGETSETITVESDGDTRHYNVDISPITDSIGTALGRVLIFTDVSDRVNRQEQLRRKTSQLERRNEQLDKFASVVSHDLRNPLQVAAGSLELVREKHDDEELERLDRSIERMETIVDDLLTLARVEKGIGDTTRVALRSVATEASQNVTLGESSVEVRDDLPTVECDPNSLSHLFENLFRNAVQHNDAPVAVTVGGTDTGFFVADDGVGVPESERETVFEHGYTSDEDGTGFGLSIVRDVVAAHGWSIQVTESDEGGARFEIDVED